MHFVGFRDDRWWNALRVFGRPDFVHPKWDQRARREIAPGDVIVFAESDEPAPPSRLNAPDFLEGEPYA
ncbi:MAG: hypothetical protein DI527_00595 [Chelatococcus sp.]|nr:MAG: hypothetical protein DI527_00595 [Chelatococcus sp.]